MKNPQNNNRPDRFDEALDFISPDLLRKYEEKNLGGKSLRQMNEKYKSLLKVPSVWLNKDEVASFLIIVVTIVLPAMLMHRVLVCVDGPWRIPLAWVLGVSASIVGFKMVLKMVRAIHETISECRKFLEEFERQIRLFIPCGVKTMIWSERDLHELHVHLAQQVLRTEESFETARNQASVSAEEMSHWSLNLIQCRSNFQFSVGAAVSMFGIATNSQEIFEKARKRLA